MALGSTATNKSRLKFSGNSQPNRMDYIKGVNGAICVFKIIKMNKTAGGKYKYKVNIVLISKVMKCWLIFCVCSCSIVIVGTCFNTKGQLITAKDNYSNTTSLIIEVKLTHTHTQQLLSKFYLAFI